MDYYDFDLIESVLEDIKLSASSVNPVSRGLVMASRDTSHSRKSPNRSRSRSRNRTESNRNSADRETDSRGDGGRRRGTQRSSQHEKSKREDCSIMVMGVHPDAGDRDVYEFFSKEAGKVRDVSVIRDSRTGKSKGVAYVEFYLQESVIKALGCNGRAIKGFPIRVQASGAEKNRAAEAQKAVHVQMQDRPVMLYILGLTGPLSAMDESDLRLLFSPFGDIDLCEIGRSPYTNKSRGFAHLQFSRTADAREAMACLNDFNLAGQTLQVGYLVSSLDEREETHADSEGYLKTNEQRSRVMHALGRDHN